MGLLDRVKSRCKCFIRKKVNVSFPGILNSYMSCNYIRLEIRNKGVLLLWPIEWICPVVYSCISSVECRESLVTGFLMPSAGINYRGADNMIFLLPKTLPPFSNILDSKREMFEKNQWLCFSFVLVLFLELFWCLVFFWVQYGKNMGLQTFFFF